ncbi:uncharacterized protein N7482_002968 [Penicillium canariense]|uniref:Thioredoxin-like fold domain-containing protein n=1 Tax=Penicillium canariense TaxID=189055 RepID=A0A9W9IK03_9EURO|nr:uncharacterized protein N7482_002968 [Penicillium canariense]KAJ5177091.1 hypothetical protein N7482_002968 [Penicillium canariense]
MALPKSTPTFTVFRGFPDKGCYVWSPFVTKLEARLRFGEISYRTEAGSVPKAPRGKVPYVSIERSDGSSESLGDSTLISKALIESGDLEDLNSNLSASQKLQDMSIGALLEDKLYFYQCHERWVLNYYAMRSKILAALPWPIQVIVGNIVYNKNVRTMEGQGTLKFSTAEIASFRHEIWDTLNNYVKATAHAEDQDGPFWILGGDGPTDADAVLFGFIASSLVCIAAPDTMSKVKSCPALVDYARRIHDKYFPDYEIWK